MPHPVWPILCILLVAVLLIAGCSFLLKQPEISVKGVSLASLNLTTMGLDVTLSVNNPNSLGITLSTLSFDVYYQNENNWVYLSHGEQSGIRIEPGENTVTIPLLIQNKELLGSLLRLISQGEITLQIRGTAKPEFFGVAPPIPFTHTTTIPLRV